MWSVLFSNGTVGVHITAYQRGEVSIDRIESILMVTPKVQDSSNAIELLRARKGELTARHLTFTYPGSTTPALKDVNFFYSAREP